MADKASSGSTLAQVPTSTKPRRPNYNELHAKLLPLRTYPLPPFIPQNPLSILYVVYTFAKQALFPPSSHQANPHYGIFSLETCSVHVTDDATVRALWEDGFFGKGNLSRSEPNWLVREKGRRGLVAGLTSEDVTQRRRDERKAFKQERARKERLEIELKLRRDRGLEQTPDLESGLLAGTEEKPLSASADGNTISEVGGKPSKAPVEGGQQTDQDRSKPKESIPAENVASDLDRADIANEEHLQLDLNEAFFLTYALGVLIVLSPTSGEPIPVSELFQLFMANAAQAISNPLSAPAQVEPDNSFLLSYVAYHHFRSLGWVVRPGVKFGADLLLYNRGPVFSHAEFAVAVIPAYSHEYWTGEGKIKRREPKRWHWLHMVNRVQSQVQKTLVLCYVEVPPPWAVDLKQGSDIGNILKTFTVREIVLKRWVPNRSRD